MGVWDPFEREGGFHEMEMAEGEPRFPLAQAADAHRALDEHFLGKLALRPG